MTVLRGWGLAEQHLALDALVAFVDGELSPTAYDRAAAHLARCRGCAAEATAQRQARAAVQGAPTPSVSPRLLEALQSIPVDAELPSQPEELALTPDGQLVTLARQDRSRKRLGSGPVLGSSTPLGRGQAPLGSLSSGDTGGATERRGVGRRTKQGAGVVFSGLVLGALAFMNVPNDPPEQAKSPERLPDSYRNSFTPAAAHLTAPQASAATDVPRKPAESPRPPADAPSSAVSTAGVVTGDMGATALRP